jgi:hypothetical protein
MQNVLTPYPSAKLASEAASYLVDNIAKVVLTPTFMTHTATDLSDEEMKVKPWALHFDHEWSPSHLHGLSPCGSFFSIGLTLPQTTPIGKA